MSEHSHQVCPWFAAYLFDNPLRRLIHDPVKIMGPYVKSGMTVIDVGCGMGYFSLGMAKLVGPEGRVLSLDIQDKMLNVLEKRARKAGLWERIHTHLIDPDGFSLGERAGFANCFWMVHEVPDQVKLFSDLADALEPGSHVLVAEPGMHVPEADLENTINLSCQAGFSLVDRPGIRFSSAALLLYK